MHHRNSGEKDKQPNCKASAPISATKAISSLAAPNESGVGGTIEAQQWVFDTPDTPSAHYHPAPRIYPTADKNALLQGQQSLCSSGAVDAIV